MASGLPNDLRAFSARGNRADSHEEQSSATLPQVSSVIFADSSPEASSLVNRVSIPSQAEVLPASAERQELLKILDEWRPTCPEDKKARIMQEILDCYDQRKTFIYIRGYSIDCLPDVFGLAGFANLTSVGFENCSSLTEIPESIGSLRGLSELGLDYCSSLTAIPESIGNLTALKWLGLSRCESLATLPESIGNLTALTTLSVTNCYALTELPMAILSLSADCTVDVTQTRLSQAVMERLSSAIRTDGYSGPQIHYSMQVASQAAAAQSLEEWLTSTFRNANLEEKALPHLLALDESDRLTIATWLSRMTDTADATSAVNTSFYQLIVNYLKLANANAEFRGVFLQVLHDASETCGDRVSLSVFHLGIAAREIACDKKDLKSYAIFLRGSIALGLLEEVARAKVQTLRFVDEIEVYLGYPVMLKDALNLPIDIQEMRFFTCSGITPEDLREAEGYVLAQVGTQEALLNQLVKNNDWLDALKAGYPEQFAAIEKARDTAMDSDDPDYVAIGRVFDQALIDLSRAALA